MIINIRKFMKGRRRKYCVEYINEDEIKFELFEFDEKKLFNTSENGESYFSDYKIGSILRDSNVYEEKFKLINLKEDLFNELVIEAVEDYFEDKFKMQFKEEQYRLYIQERNEIEVLEDRIRFEEEYGEKFDDNDHFKKYYVNIINHNYDTNFKTYNESKRHQRSEGWKKVTGQSSSNNWNINEEEEEIFQEVLKEGFKKMSKKYHPDVDGDEEKMKILNSLKEKLDKNRV